MHAWEGGAQEPEQQEFGRGDSEAGGGRGGVPRTVRPEDEVQACARLHSALPVRHEIHHLHLQHSAPHKCLGPARKKSAASVCQGTPPGREQGREGDRGGGGGGGRGCERAPLHPRPLPQPGHALPPPLPPHGGPGQGRAQEPPPPSFGCRARPGFGRFSPERPGANSSDSGICPEGSDEFHFFCAGNLWGRAP